MPSSLGAWVGALGYFAGCFSEMPGKLCKSKHLTDSCSSCFVSLPWLCSRFWVAFSSEICPGACSEMPIS